MLLIYPRANNKWQTFFLVCHLGSLLRYSFKIKNFGVNQCGGSVNELLRSVASRGSFEARRRVIMESESDANCTPN